MIASVRIAPVERWCEPMKKLAATFPNPPKIGGEICIDTSTLKIDSGHVLCTGRAWLVVKYPTDCLGVDLDSQELTDSDCSDGGENWVCEHVLELGD